ncbi:MAG: hypothetical protein ACT6FE_01350 [Methanosarcinaceae archaeon]
MPDIIDSSDFGDAKVLQDIQVESIHKRVDCSCINVGLVITVMVLKISKME